MLDVHTHILPHMDDGSASVEETLAMLRASADQGVDEIIATPHFYAGRETPESFLARRQAAFDSLAPCLRAEKGLPSIRLGAEVRYFEGISNAGLMEELAIQGTRCVLVEMPFQGWGQRALQEMHALQRQRELRPILAHVERYSSFQDTALLRSLSDDGILLQMNAEVFASFFSRRRALKLLREGIVHFLGSDCHNMADRKPNLAEGFQVFRQRCGDEFVNQWLVHGNNLMGG